jgi:hypothetical protein
MHHTDIIVRIIGGDTNMLPYAEQILDEHKSNQWFIRFYTDSNDLQSESVRQSHMQWFANQGLTLTQVRTLEFDLPTTNFYHVNFASAQDARLTAYSDLFEDFDGVSLQPDVYQLYEWSYSDWVEQGLQLTWMNSQVQSD